MSRDATAWFERLYHDADRDIGQVPWARGRADPGLLAWLDQPGLTVAGSDALVVGCGLGDDAAELARRGCRVVAVDVSPTAIRWARERHADVHVSWRVVDVLDGPDDLIASAGLVVEVRVLQSLPERLRARAMAAIASTVAPGGLLVHVGLVATGPRAAHEWQGPPWAIAPEELDAYERAGLERIDLAHPPAVDGPAMEIVLVMRRPEGAGDGRPEGAGDGRLEGAGDGRLEGAGDGRLEGAGDGRPEGAGGDGPEGAP